MTGDQFGQGVALDGDTLVIGADGRGDAGEVWVFRKTNGRWLHEAILIGSQTVPDDNSNIGEVVAISGDTIVAGLPRKDHVWEDAGIAYVFVRNGTVWSEQAILTAPQPHFLARFGWAVAIQGDQVAISAPQTPAPHERQGVVEVFERAGTQWSHVTRLVASNAAEVDTFGEAVGMDSGRIIVGAVGRDEACPTDPNCDSGAIYVFEQVGSSWVEVDKLTAGDGKKGDRLGEAVAIHGGLVLGGAPRGGDNGIDTGAAYVFRQSGTTWIEENKFVPHDGEHGDQFGSHLAISADTALVFGCADEWQTCSGAAYLYRDAGGSWPLAMKMLAPQITRNYGSGGIAIQGDTICIGARREKANGVSSAGAGYIYEMTPGTLAPTVYCTAKTNSCGTMPSIRIAGIPSATSGGGLFVTASATPVGKSGLLLYTDTGRATLPFQGGTLCVEPSNLSRSLPVMDTTGTVGCDGELSIDMNAFAAGSLGGTPQPFLVVPGTHVNAQYWGRDEVTTGNLLSDAVEWAICP